MAVVGSGDQQFSADPVGFHRNRAIAKRIRKLFAAAGLPGKSPHKFRHGHAVYALQHAKTMADYKAISMNLMHADIHVTDGIYAPLTSDEVKQLSNSMERDHNRQLSAGLARRCASCMSTSAMRA